MGAWELLTFLSGRLAASAGREIGGYFTANESVALRAPGGKW